jgi:hypothetical protein
MHVEGIVVVIALSCSSRKVTVVGIFPDIAIPDVTWQRSPLGMSE